VGGELDLVDTPLEFALLSYYSQPVLNIRPPEANAILPANNPKLADTKLGAAVFQELQVLRFLGDTAAVNRHEEVLRFITGRGNVTRAEVEAFYRNNIGALISPTYDRIAEEVLFASSRIIQDFKQVILNFYTSPSQATFTALNQFYIVRNNDLERTRQTARTMGDIFYATQDMDGLRNLVRHVYDYDLAGISRLIERP